MTLPDRLKRERERKGLTCQDVDALAGLTQGHTAQIESGRRANPAVDTVNRLARALDLDLNYLVNGKK